MPLRLPSTLAACARWALGLWLCVALASAFAPLARASGWERLCSAAGESVWVPSPAGQDNALVSDVRTQFRRSLFQSGFNRRDDLIQGIGKHFENLGHREIRADTC